MASMYKVAWEAAWSGLVDFRSLMWRSKVEHHMPDVTALMVQDIGAERWVAIRDLVERPSYRVFPALHMYQRVRCPVCNTLLQCKDGPAVLAHTILGIARHVAELTETEVDGHHTVLSILVDV